MAVSSDTGLIGGDEGGTMDDLDLGCDDDFMMTYWQKHEHRTARLKSVSSLKNS